MSNEKQKFGLGQGLGSLLGNTTTQKATVEHIQSSEVASDNSYPHTLPLSALRPNQWQPRKQINDEDIEELADSIITKGVLQPILVRPITDSNDEYEIVAGERRWRASQKANLENIPVVVKEFDDKQSAEIALVENLQREDLSPLDEALGFDKLMKNFGYTQDVVAQGIGKSRSYVANMLRLLTLPDDVKDLLDSKQISMGHARALISSEDPMGLAKEILENSLNVRETEELVKADKEQKENQPSKKNTPPIEVKLPEPVRYASEKISTFFSKEIKISHGKGKNQEGGTIIIEYKTIDELENIVNKFDS